MIDFTTISQTEALAVTTFHITVWFASPYSKIQCIPLGLYWGRDECASIPNPRPNISFLVGSAEAHTFYAINEYHENGISTRYIKVWYLHTSDFTTAFYNLAKDSEISVDQILRIMQL